LSIYRTIIADATSNRIVGINHFTKQALIQLVIIEEKANLLSSFGSWTQHNHYSHLDLGMLAAHIILAATDEGLGSCVIGWFDEQKVQNVLHIPSSKRVLMIILLGYSSHHIE
jgi:nitroreductase